MIARMARRAARTRVTRAWRPRVAPFVVVGLLGFALQMSALVLLTRAHLPYALALALAVEAAILHNFLWHERWTWQDRPAAAWRTRLARLLRFNGTSGLTSIAGNLAVTILLVEIGRVPVPAASAVAVIATSALNFTLADRWIFDAPSALR